MRGSLQAAIPGKFRLKLLSPINGLVMRIGLRVGLCGAGPCTVAPAAGPLESRVASLQVSPHRSFARWHAALVLVLSLALGACSTTNFQQQVVAPVAPQSFTSTSTKYAAIVIDGANGRVLYQSSAEAG